MSKGTILVVEDNNIVAQDLRSRLLDLGYDVSGTAKSGEEAVEKAVQTRPSLVLMDIKLRGEMDGVEAARVIRERLDVPVVYLTAYTDEKTLGRAKITEPFGYVVKPFDETALHTNIEIALFKHAMEKKLKESEQWLATTLRCIGDATIATDADGYVKILNPAAESLTGWVLDDARGQHWRVIMAVSDEKSRRAVEIPIDQEGATGQVTLWDRLVLVDKFGSEKNVEMTAAPITDESDTRIGLVLVFKDISERRVTEEAREQSHTLLQAVLDGTRDIIFLKNTGGRFMMINAAGSRLLERPVSEIIGRTDSELFGPGAANLLGQGHERALSSGEPQTFECAISSGGVERTYLISEEICRASEGNAVGVLGIARDITEVTIEGEPLKQTDKLAETGRTVGLLAHEMEQSVASISESLPPIKHLTSEDPTNRRHIDEIEDELARISRAVRQMSALYWNSRSRRVEEKQE